MNKVKNLMFCLSLLISVTGITAQSQYWQWITTGGGTSYDQGTDITTDSQSNQYITGDFHGTADFGSTQLISIGSNDVFVAKLDRYGAYIWAVRAGGLNNDRGCSITIDAVGNIYVTGLFQGSAAFGDMTIYSSGNDDVFVAKLDPLGNWLWVCRGGGTSGDEGCSIDTDQDGYAYVSGVFAGTATFGALTLTSNGFSDAFIGKLGPNGDWLWVIRAGGSQSDRSLSIAANASGNIYITGYFNNTAIFGNSTLISSGNSDIFVAKVDSYGNWVWAVKGGGTAWESGTSVALDNAGNVYITGSFGDTVLFGPHSISSIGFEDVFVAKLDSNGNWLQAVRGGGSSSEGGVSLDLDSYNNIYITGQFTGSTSFGGFNLTSSGNVDVFIAKLDPIGNWQWAIGAGGSDADCVNSIVLDLGSNCYITGYFYGTASFGAITIGSLGNSDVFIAKVSSTAPTAYFTADPCSGIEPLTVLFTDQSYNGLYPITNWIWSFGDNSFSSSQNPTHTYINPGLYSVSLTVIDQNFQTSTQVRSEYITAIERVYSIELLSEDHLSFLNVYLEEQSSWQPVVITNTGNVDVNLITVYFTNAIYNFELSEPHSGIVLTPGGVDSLWVRFAPQQVGAIVDTLVIVNNSSNQPLIKIRLTGTGEYVPLQIPQNLIITVSGNDIHLCWDAVTLNMHNQPITTDYYFVFSCDDPYGHFIYHGATSGLQYTLPMVGLFQPRMFYRIVAYKYYGLRVFDPETLGLVPGMREEEVWRLLP